MSISNPPFQSTLVDADGRTQTPWVQWFSQLQPLLNSVNSSGPTSARPTSGLYIGYAYFDTTLNQMVYWSGVIWIVNAPATTGTSILKGNGTGGFNNAISGIDFAPATTGAAILFGNAAGGFNSVTIGSGVTFAGGVLSALGSGGTVTSVSGTGSVNGITLTGTVTSSGSLTLGGTLGGIGNSQLTNSSITINGSTVSLGGSTTVTATATNALTIGTGLSGTSYNGSTAVTIANTGVTSFSGNSTGLTPATATTGAITLAGILVGANGGTGVANTGKTFTIAGNFTTSGAFTTSLAVTANTSLTLPISGTVLSSVTAPTANPITGTPSASNYLRGDGTWATFTTGTVTSVSGTGTVNGITLTGTVTSSGSLTLGGTLGSIANSQLTNSSITFGATAQALGSTVSALNAVSIGATTASTGAFTTLTTSGSAAIGSTINASQNLRIGAPITGSTGSIATQSLGTIQSDVTSTADYYRTNAATLAAAFTLATLRHYSCVQGTIGVGSVVTTQIGFYADVSIAGATNNYGVNSTLASGTGKWNIYAQGTAANYFAGNILIGTTTQPTTASNIVIAGLLATSAAAPTIASATTIAPTKAITFISGTTAIVTITAPNPISVGGGQITLIPTGIFATTTAGNIALVTTAVVGKALIMTYDTTTAKWYPSY